ncbi:MAG TPA: metallophosphoesterase [Candidatus Saccharimonadales bacterium]|nr:metallophosphoesterase [Candidatus Saccharimonadales bacterium]
MNGLEKKFNGFFIPERQQGSTLLSRPFGRKERIVVVSDIHGAKPEVVKRLESLVDKPPRAVILGGDVIGTQDLEDLQRLYYGLTNYSRNEALKDHAIAGSDEKLLAYSGNVPPHEGYTIRGAFIELRTKELELENKKLDADGRPVIDIEQRLHDLTDEEIAQEVRRYGEYIHWGHYASNLPDEAKDALADGLAENAKLVAAPLARLQEAGVIVAINEGNWDPSPPIEFEPGKPEAVRIARENQRFNAKAFFNEEGVPYFTDMDILKTKTAAIVLLPFDKLVDFSKMDQTAVEEYATPIAEKVQQAREEGKQIIVVQHAEAFWEPHNLNHPDAVPRGEHSQILNGLEKVMRYIRPDEVLHGHFHDPFVDEEGTSYPDNTKYAQQIPTDGPPILIEDQNFGGGQTVVSFMPLQRFAELIIPVGKRSNRRKIRGFGGKRQPAEVS